MSLKNYTLLAILCLLSMGGNHAYAQAKEKVIPESTPTHIVGFTFHKLADTTPNYSKWAEVYLKGKLNGFGEEGKKERIKRIKSSFRSTFNNFNLENHEEVIIKFPARMEIIPFEGRYLMSISVGAGLDFIIKETPERLINLVVPDISEKLKTVISKKDYANIRKSSGLNFEKPQNLILILKLRPVSVDNEKPVSIEGKEYWLMLMKFETYELWSDRRDVHYWDYITEEDKQKKLDDLRSLYKEEDENVANPEQIIEPFEF